MAGKDCEFCLQWFFPTYDTEGNLTSSARSWVGNASSHNQINEYLKSVENPSLYTTAASYTYCKSASQFATRPQEGNKGAIRAMQSSVLKKSKEGTGLHASDCPHTDTMAMRSLPLSGLDQSSSSVTTFLVDSDTLAFSSLPQDSSLYGFVLLFPGITPLPWKRNGQGPSTTAAENKQGKPLSMLKQQQSLPSLVQRLSNNTSYGHKVCSYANNMTARNPRPTVYVQEHAALQKLNRITHTHTHTHAQPHPDHHARTICTDA